jgi:hypothetical protein
MVEKTLGQEFYETVGAVTLAALYSGPVPAWEDLDDDQRLSFETSARAKSIEFFHASAETLRGRGRDYILRLFNEVMNRGV